MKYGTYHIILLILCSIYHGTAQDLPLFNQKLTNSFLYNPSVAGNGLGSVTLSNRIHWNGVPGAPKSYLLSAHTPFGYQKYGIGINLISEKIGVLDANYAHAAFAYHLPLNEDSDLSFGLSAEYALLSKNLALIDARDDNDALFTPDNRSSMDFSVGISYRNPYLNIGLSSNRLATALGITEFQTQISQFYTGYAIATLPITQFHKVEPMFTFRKLSTESAQWDAGLYYSYRDGIILGMNYRSNGILSPTVALHFDRKLLIGYSFEMFGSDIRRDVGGTHEVTLRFDFMRDSYYTNIRNSPEVMRQSIAFRRKTLTYSRLKGTPMSASNPRYKKRVGRNYMKSPNYRLNRSSLLSSRKFGLGIFKRSPLVVTKAKANKRRKTNYRKYSRKMKRIR